MSVGRNKWGEMNGPRLSRPSCTWPKFNGTMDIEHLILDVNTGLFKLTAYWILHVKTRHKWTSDTACIYWILHAEIRHRQHVGHLCGIRTLHVGIRHSMHIGYSMCTLNSWSRLHIGHLMDTIINYANGVSNMHSTCCSKCSHKVANINMTCVISPSKVQYADHKEYSMFTWSIQYPYEVPKMLLKSNNCEPEINFFHPNSTFTSPKSTLTYPNLTITRLNSTII